MAKYHQLPEFERERISKMLAAGCSYTEIAIFLGRSISTVGREVYRNCADGECLAIEAHKKASMASIFACT
jgi:IS30 family transposase